MILRNPTNTDVRAQLFGVKYTIPAEGELELPNKAGLEWKNSIHQFLEIVSGDESFVPAPAPEDETTEEDPADAPVTTSEEEVEVTDGEDSDGEDN